MILLLSSHSQQTLDYQCHHIRTFKHNQCNGVFSLRHLPPRSMLKHLSNKNKKRYKSKSTVMLHGNGNLLHDL